MSGALKMPSLLYPAYNLLAKNAEKRPEKCLEKKQKKSRIKE